MGLVKRKQRVACRGTIHFLTPCTEQMFSEKSRGLATVFPTSYFAVHPVFYTQQGKGQLIGSYQD